MLFDSKLLGKQIDHSVMRYITDFYGCLSIYGGNLLSVVETYSFFLFIFLLFSFLYLNVTYDVRWNSFCIFGGFRPTRECFTHLETLPLPVKGCKLWPTLGSHGHWAVRFFSVPHLLWHGVSVYNGHFRRTVTLTSFSERLAVKLSLPVLTTLVCRGWDSNTQPSACVANVLTHCATAAALF